MADPSTRSLSKLIFDHGCTIRTVAYTNGLSIVVKRPSPRRMVDELLRRRVASRQRGKRRALRLFRRIVCAGDGDHVPAALQQPAFARR